MLSVHKHCGFEIPRFNVPGAYNTTVLEYLTFYSIAKTSGITFIIRNPIYLKAKIMKEL